MVPQNNLTQPHEIEETGEDYVSSETQENTSSSSSSTISSLVSGVKSVAFDVSSYWAKVL